MFIKKASNSHGWVMPRDIEQMWKDHFEWLYENEPDFVFPVRILAALDSIEVLLTTSLIFFSLDGDAADHGAPRRIRQTPGARNAREVH